MEPGLKANRTRRGRLGVSIRNSAAQPVGSPSLQGLHRGASGGPIGAQHGSTVREGGHAHCSNTPCVRGDITAGRSRSLPEGVLDREIGISPIRPLATTAVAVSKPRDLGESENPENGVVPVLGRHVTDLFPAEGRKAVDSPPRNRARECLRAPGRRGKALAMSLVASVIAAASGCVADSPSNIPSVSFKPTLSPKIPWPPYMPSTRQEVTEQLRLSYSGSTLQHVDDKITKALDENGYHDTAYFVIPDGFALATRLEQVAINGERKDEPDRWFPATTTSCRRSIGEYVKCLLYGWETRYRLFVFVVASRPFSPTLHKPAIEEVDLWWRTGLNRLPDEVAAVPYTDSHDITALIYEFTEPTENDKAHWTASSVSGYEHLVIAGIWEAFES